MGLILALTTEADLHIQQWFDVPDAFTHEECDRIQSLCDDIMMEQAGVINAGKSRLQLSARNCKSGWLAPNMHTQWLFDKVKDIVIGVNKRTFQFEISEMEQLQYLEYGFGQFYGTHVDNGDDAVATRKLTMVLQLSDPKDYLGGNLTIHSQSESRHAPRGRGAVAIFPSHLPHKANPVWLGKRKSLVAWMRGKRPLS